MVGVGALRTGDAAVSVGVASCGGSVPIAVGAGELAYKKSFSSVDIDFYFVETVSVDTEEFVGLQVGREDIGNPDGFAGKRYDDSVGIGASDIIIGYKRDRNRVVT